MKKRGFTLIELLAVIVVLAILALILVPIVTTTIKNAKKGSAEVSAQHYVKAIELAVSNSELNKKHIPDGTYTIDSEGNLTGSNLPNGKLEIEATGTKPNGGTIVIKNGQVTTESTMTVGDYDVSYDNSTSNYVAKELYKGILCTANTTKVSASIYDSSTNKSSTQEVGLLASDASSKYDVGVTYTCELGDNDAKTFFVLETNGDKVSLIMDRNIDSTGKGTTSGNTVAWLSEEDWTAAGGVVTDAMKNDGGTCQYLGTCMTNEYGPITALEYLKNSTKNWAKLTKAQISLPTGQQIATAGGDTAWTDSKSSTRTILSTWLYGNLNVNYSEPIGYWTSTPDASAGSISAWDVLSEFGSLFNADNEIRDDDRHGVRPVITVAKSQLG